MAYKNLPLLRKLYREHGGKIALKGLGKQDKHKEESTLVLTGYTEDQCNGGVATDSDHYSDRVVARCFDNLFNNFWQSYLAGVNQWVNYEFSESKRIRKYRILCNEYLTSRSPKDWLLEASNNGIDWTTLDTQSGVINWTSSIWKDFEIVNNVSYIHYRFHVTDVAQTVSNSIMVTEVEMMEGVYS